MENKKKVHADLTRKRHLFLVIGLALSLSMTLTAFEWKTFSEGDLMDLGSVPDDFEELVDIPQTIIPPPPPPPVQAPPKLIEVPDDEEIDVELPEIDVTFDETTVLEEIANIEEPEEEVAPEIFLVVEEEAEFPGGDKAWAKFLKKNFKYPRQAQRMGIEGRVFLSFVVDTNGTISDIVVTRGIGGGCDEEAKRVLSKSPHWKPGKQRGVAVKSRMALQIAFRLK